MHTFIRENHAVEQTVVVVINELCSLRILGTRGRNHRLELLLAIADRKQTRPIGSSQKEIRETVLVNIAGSNARPGAVNIQTNFDAYIAECAVALIAVEVRRFAIIDYEKVYIPSIVEIGRHD